MLGVHADITRQEDVDRLFDAALERFGRLDVLVNNAGRSMRGKVLDTTPEQFRELMELNFIALVRCTRAAVPHLLKQRGHVVNIGSLAAKSAARWVGAYPATKFAVAAYSQQLRLELGPRDCTCCWSARARSRERTSGSIRWRAWKTCPSVPGGPGRACGPRPSRPSGSPRRSSARASVAGRSWSCPARARLLFALSQLWPRLGDWLVLRKT